MLIKTIFIFILATLPIIDGSNLNPSQNQTEYLNKNEAIILPDNLSILVSTSEGKYIGYIWDVYKPSMNLPEGCVLQLKPKQKKDMRKYVRIYYDANWEGLFTDLHVDEKYSASQISLPSKSISSVIIPIGYQVKLYTEDNFAGNSVLKNFQTDNRDLRDNYINDKTVSLEIFKIKNIAEQNAINMFFITPFLILGAVAYLD
jgi:hypothetical protein